MKRFLSLVLLGGILATKTVFAQSESIDLSIIAIPNDPLPLQQVRLEVKSYAMNLDSATITWKSDGRILDSGVGRTRLTVTAPANGGVATITASVGGIGQAVASITLRPSSVDMLWEAADAYTPPFYKGKALPPINGVFRVTAIPAANVPRNLVYRWSRNGSSQQTSSGYGKSSLLFRNSELQTTERVDVSAESGNFTGASSITITPRAPSLVAYQSIDGFIDYANGSTKTISSNQPGTVVRFEPYYFSRSRSITSDLSFNFDVADQPIAGTQTPNELRLSRPEGGGAVSIHAVVDTVTYSLQHIDRLFTLIFE
jgi:hypothetical protein